jgi:hypothetical protein
MIMPSIPVVLVSIAVFAILAALDWFVGGLAYSRKYVRRGTGGLPRSRSDNVRWVKKRLRRAA